jgi:thiol-disulfide isomerase/thioredoxin
MRRRRLRQIVTVVLVCAWIALGLVLGVVLAAAEQRPLRLDLVAPSGEVVTATRFPADERWVLVYVAPSCGSCDRLLAALAQWRSTLPANRIAIVVEADADAARSYVEARGIEAAGFAWFADVGSASARAMDVQRLPALAGIGGGEVSWSVDGVLNQPEVAEPVIRSWITQ